MTVRLVSSVEIVRIARTAGFGAIYIDLEHSAFSIETACQLSVMALEAIDEIAAVDGVDLVLIGFNDFLADLGRPGEYDHPKLREAYARTIGACKARRKHVGARFVSTGTDLAFLLAAASERAKQIRNLKT
jgi:2-keto-3-deoxy-L-rhamnonate aldolase RhmA